MGVGAQFDVGGYNDLPEKYNKKLSAAARVQHINVHSI